MQIRKSLFVLLAVFFVVAGVEAGSIFFTGSGITVNNTTFNGSTNSIGAVVVPGITFNFTYGNLSSTNELTNYVQLSLDGTNFITAATWQPSSTTGQTVQYSPSFSPQTIFCRVQTVTTGTVTNIFVIGNQ